MAKHFHIAWLLCCLVTLAGCRSGQKDAIATALPAAAVASTAPKASATGWTFTSVGHSYGRLRAINSPYLWSSLPGQIIMYDMRSRQRVVFGDVDGLPLAGNRINRLVVADDNRAAFFLEDGPPRIYYYQPNHKWSQLPPLPEEWRPQDLCFNQLGNLTALVKKGWLQPKQYRLYEFIDGQWKLRHNLTMPNVLALVPVDHGYLVKSYKDHHTGLWFVPYTSHDAAYPAPLYRGELNMNTNGLLYVRLQGQTYLINGSSLPYVHRRTAYVVNAVRHVTMEGIDQPKPGRPLMLDLVENKFIPITITSTTKGYVYHLQLGTNQNSPQLTFDADGGMPIRELNGDIRTSLQRWSKGKMHSWSEECWLPNAYYCIFPDRAWYDDKLGRWRSRVPKAYVQGNAMARLVDRQRMLAWVVSDYKTNTMQLMDFSQPDKPRTLQTRSYDPDWGLPRFKDSQGGWWTYRNHTYYLRPDGKAQKIFTPRSTTPHAMSSPPPMLSPHSGRVWFRDGAYYWYYNYQTHKLVESDLKTFCEDFSYQLGAVKIALIPGRYDNLYDGAKIHVDGQWLDLSLGRTDWINAFDVRGDRLLIASAGQGVWEYDGTHDRLICLAPGVFHVGFDEQGRRILSSFGSVLIYTGDPFKDPAYQPYLQISETQRQLFRQSIKLLASPINQGYEYALSQLRNLAPMMNGNLLMLMKNRHTPEPLRKELKSIVDNNKNKLAIPSLWRVAFPLTLNKPANTTPPSPKHEPPEKIRVVPLL